MNPTYSQLVRELEALHDAKSDDYTNGDPYSNFAFAAKLAEGFTHPMDRTFATLVGVKLARLIELTKPGRVPLNESVKDTRRDLANYVLIWTAWAEGGPEDDGCGATCEAPVGPVALPPPARGRLIQFERLGEVAAQGGSDTRFQDEPVACC